jgi:hypothetical protein
MFMRREERGREAGVKSICDLAMEEGEGRREKQKRSEIEDRGGKQG